MNLCYGNSTIRLNQRNKVFIDSMRSYYEFLRIIYDKSSTINGNIISKNFKIYNLCDYEIFKTSKQLKRNTLLDDYLSLRIKGMDEQQKNHISDRIFDIIHLLNAELSISNNSIIDDLNCIIYNLVSEQDINIDDLSIEKMLEFIITNTDGNYLIIYDSSLINLTTQNNLISFDINSHLEMSEYNIICFFNELRNLNVNVIIEDMYKYWPLPIEKNELECEINNKFLSIISSSKVYTYDHNSLILAKLINYFYQTNIKIKYYGNDNTIKSFLSSNLNY